MDPVWGDRYRAGQGLWRGRIAEAIQARAGGVVGPGLPFAGRWDLDRQRYAPIGQEVGRADRGARYGRPHQSYVGLRSPEWHLDFGPTDADECIEEALAPQHHKI